MSAPDNKLKDLFDAVCDGLADDLQNPERRTPGVYQAALKLLEQNNITALPVPGSKVSKVAEALKDAPFPFPASKTGT